MRHITDGELHAYLDGSLDQLPDQRGDEIRDHLDGCEACNERLQDEEEIRNQAQELMALTAPPEVDLPSFESIRARAEAAEEPGGEGEKEAPARYRGPLRGLPLAWAATVVLALGVGWMGGQVMEASGPPNFGPPLPPSPGVGQAAVGEASNLDRSEEPARNQPLVAGVREALPEAPGARDEMVADEVQTVRGDRQRAAAELQAGSVPVEEEMAADPSLEEARRKSVSQGSLVPSAQAGRELASPEERLQAQPSVAPGPEEAGFTMAMAPMADEEGAMAVPGLEVLAVEWEEWVPGERALHIRQRLPMGDTLELRYLGLLMGSDPSEVDAGSTQGQKVVEGESQDRPLSPKVLEASLPPGWNQVIMRWRRGWLVARAPLSEESLRGILRSLR